MYTVDQMFVRAEETLSQTPYCLRCWLKTYRQQHFRPVAFDPLTTQVLNGPRAEAIYFHIKILPGGEKTPMQRPFSKGQRSFIKKRYKEAQEVAQSLSIYHATTPDMIPVFVSLKSIQKSLVPPQPRGGQNAPGSPKYGRIHYGCTF
jgi:hypothetical protein